MGLFDSLFIDIKNASKTTYSEEDIKKLERSYEREFFEEEDRKIKSPFRKETPRASLTQLRDYAYEKVLDRHLYTFKHMLVIPNPYGVSLQTALLLFNSSKEYRVHYRIIGDTVGADVEGDTPYTTRHRVPILGLYANRLNHIELSMYDREGKLYKRRKLTIYVRELYRDLSGLVEGVLNKEMSHFPIIMLSGGQFGPMAIDCNGAIRYKLQLKSRNIGMIPMKNGHFLFEDRTINRMSVTGRSKPCCYHEMDYMGRIYQTFLLDRAIGKVIAQNADSLFVLANTKAPYVLDSIMEISRKTGKVQAWCKLAQLFGDKHVAEGNWADINFMDYKDGCLLINMRRLKSIVKLNWQKQTVEWIMAPISVWKGTDMEKAVQDMEESFKVDDETIIELLRQNLVLSIRNQQKEEKSVCNLTLATIENESQAVKTQQTVATEEIIGYTNSVISEDLDNLVVISSKEVQTEEKLEKHAVISSYQLSTGKKVQTLEVTKPFVNAWEFNPDIEDYSRCIEKNANAVVGELKAPKRFTKIMPEVSNERLLGRFFNRPTLQGDLFIFNVLPGTVDRIYFIGKENQYVQDYEIMLPRLKKERQVIHISKLAPDEYKIYVESDGVVHLLKNDIRISK